MQVNKAIGNTGHKGVYASAPVNFKVHYFREVRHPQLTEMDILVLWATRSLMVPNASDYDSSGGTLEFKYILYLIDRRKYLEKYR